MVSVSSRATPLLLLGLTGVLLAAANTIVLGPPSPAFHDEFGYLLQADTFSRGRLANPSPPPGTEASFETFHTLQSPTYVAKYPPANGLLLAAGQVIGHPIVGVWLGFGLLGPATAWMLLAFLNRRWALLGGLLTLAQLGVATYWVSGYWSAVLPATGGALVLGAAPRLLRRPSSRDAIVMGIGLAVLANTRPFEGLVLSLLPASLFVLTRRGRRACFSTEGLRRVTLPLAGVLLLCLALMALYNRATTTRWLEAPYTSYEKQYSPYPLFLTANKRDTPAYSSEPFRLYYGEWLSSAWERQQSASGWISFKMRGLLQAGQLYFGPILVLPLVLGGLRLRRRGVGYSLAAIAILLAALAGTVSIRPHYLGLVLAPAMLLVTLGIATCWTLASRRFRRSRRWTVWVLGITLVAACTGERLWFWDDTNLKAAASRSVSLARPEIESTLSQAGGQHLVLVETGRYSSPHDDWVFNGAELAEQSVVWARWLGPEQNAELLEAFPERRAWHVRIGVRGPGDIGLDELSRP